MARIIFNFCTFTSMQNGPKAYKICQNTFKIMPKIKNKPSNNCQSGKISPNLVTLDEKKKKRLGMAHFKKVSSSNFKTSDAKIC